MTATNNMITYIKMDYKNNFNVGDKLFED